MPLNEYDEMLTDGQIAEGNEYDRIANDIKQGQTATLKQSVKQASKTAPDAKAKARQMADRLKMPVEMIERNPELFTERDTVESLPYEDLLLASPKLAEWFASPVNAGVARDDVSGMQRIDQAVTFLDSVRRGVDVGQSLFYGAAEATGELVGADSLTAFGRAGRVRNVQESQQYGTRASITAIRGGWDLAQWMKETIGEQIPMFAPVAAGAGAGALAGTFVFPGVGTAIGAAIGAFIPGFAMGVGEVQSSVKELGGEQAQAPAAAFIGGTAIAALDTVLPGRIGSRLVRTFGRDVAEQVAVRALAKPVAQRYIRRVAGSVAGSMATEGLTEAIQEAVGDVAAAAGTDTAVDWAQTAAHMLEAGAAGALVGGAAGGVTEAITPNPRVTAGQHTAHVLTGLGEALTNSKTAERDPKSVEDFIALKTKDSPVETLYAPVETWITYWQSKGLDPATMAADVTGDAQAFDVSVATGAKLPIPLSRYAATLAATDHNAFWANELSLAPELMSAREEKEFQQAQLAAEPQAEEAPTAAPVRDALVPQLEAAGFTPKVAEAYATLYEAAFGQLATRAGMTPTELFGRYGLEIRRQQTPSVSTGTGPALSRADGDNQAVFAQSLMDDGATDAELLADLFVGETALTEGDRLLRIPSFAGMVAKVRRAALVHPEVFGAIVRLVPVDVVNDLFGSERAAENALRNEPVFQDGAALDTDLSVAAGIDAASPVGLLLSEAARAAAELPPVFPRAGRKTGKGLTAASADATRPLVSALGQVAPLTTEMSATEMVAGRKDAVEGDAASRTVTGLRFGQGERASISFLPDGKVRISLFDKADLSSVLHESGHLYLEILRDLGNQVAAIEPSARTEQQQGILTDLATLQEWFADEDHRGEGFSVKQHEQFARGFEAYLMEGKAPSPELRSVFAKFSAWLTRLYKSLRGLNVELTPEVRGVFDRLLASDEAIAAAEAEGRVVPLFTDAASAGVTEEQFSTYRNVVQAASEQAREQLTRQFLAEVQREQTDTYKAQRKAIRQEVLKDIQSRPVYRARAAILRGTNPDGTPLIEGQKPVPWKGVPLDQVAEFFGFSSGDELAQALKAAPPMPRAIKAETDARMKAEHPDLLSDPAALAEEAQAAVFGEGRAKVISAELKALTTGMARGVVPSASVVKQIAETRVAAMKVRHLTPGQFLMAAQRASQRAFEAFAKNDRAATIQAKQQELLSLAMYRAARDAKAAADKVPAWVRRNDTTTARAVLGRAGETYVDQWDGVLHQYELKNVSNKVLDRRASLKDWMESQQALGLPMDLPPAVVAQARRVNYRDLTVDQLEAVMDTLKAIRHFARFKDDLLTKEGRRQMAEIEGAVVGRLYESAKPGRTVRLTRSQSMLDRAQKWGRNIASSMLNPDTILRELDGWTNLGPVYEHVKGQIDRAIVEDLLPRSRAAGERLEQINSVYDRGELQKAEFIPALRDSLTKEEILAVALNWGTADNRAALLESKKFAALKANERTVEAILDRLDQRDWDYVQAVWDYYNTFWDEIRSSGLRRTGIAPTKVEAVPVQTKYGTYRGGYHPLKYDPEGSILATQDQIQDIAKRMQLGRFAAAQTSAGFRIERQGSGGRPVLLSLSVIGQHVNEVIYDLAMGDAIRYSDRVLRSRAVREAFEATGADDAYHALQLWLHDVAAGEIVSADSVSKTARYLRSGLTVSALAFNVGTVAVQPSGIAQTFAVLQKRDAVGGLVDLLTTKWTGPGNVFEQVTTASPFMATRQSTFNKDILTAMEHIKGTPTTPAHALKAGFYLIVKAQWLVDVATWLGAQRQGLREFDGDTKRADAFADRMVARAQASGLFADRSGIERGTLSARTRQSEFVRMWTTLGSYMFAKGNVLYEKTRSTNFKNPAEVMGYTVDLALLFAVEAMFVSLMRGSFDDDDSLAWGWLKETAKGMIASVPFLREAGSEIEGFRGGGVIGTISNRIGNAVTQVGQGEIDAALIKAINSLGGVLFHYPSSQMNRLIDAGSREVEGEEVPLADYLIYRENAR